MKNSNEHLVPWEEELREDFKKLDLQLISQHYQDTVIDWFLSKFSSHHAHLKERVDQISFTLNIDEYRKIVEEWNGKNFDFPFDEGYKQAKSDIKNLLE